MRKTTTLAAAAALAAVFALGLAMPASAECGGHATRTVDTSTATPTVADTSTVVVSPDKGS